MGSEIESLKREFRKEIRDLKSSLDFVSKEYESLKKECSDIKRENTALKATQGTLLREIECLKKTTQENAMRITAQDQYSRNKNVEIKGIPQAANENLAQVLTKIGDALGEAITEHDIEACHRVPARSATARSNASGHQDSSVNSNIVVCFNRRVKRDALMAKAKRTRINSEDLGFATKQPVYINEHLCPQLKRLLGLTIARKRELNWRFAWTRGGKVFARKTDTSRAIQMTSEADLDKMREGSLAS